MKFIFAVFFFEEQSTDKFDWTIDLKNPKHVAVSVTVLFIIITCVLVCFTRKTQRKQTKKNVIFPFFCV